MDIASFVARYRRCADWGFEARVPAAPTDTMPGSAARIAEYARRVALGQPMFVEGDRLGNRPPKAYADPISAHQIITEGTSRRGDAFDQFYRYRYMRWFQFSAQPGRHVVFVGMRPCEQFDRAAASWALFHRFNCLSVVNLHAVRAADEDLTQTVDPVGALNNYVIRVICETASLVVLAWGDGQLPDREIVMRGAYLAYVIRSRVGGDRLKVFGVDRWLQPLPIDPMMPIESAPYLTAEREINEEESRR